MMFATVAVAILVSLALVLSRAILGPTMFDRVMAANSVGTLCVMLLAVVGFLNGRPDFLDLSITYAFLNIIGTIAVLKFFRVGDLGHSGDEPTP